MIFKPKQQKAIAVILIPAGIFFIVTAVVKSWVLLGIAGTLHLLFGVLLFLDNRSTDKEGVR